jgi:hypothetical protein
MAYIARGRECCTVYGFLTGFKVKIRSEALVRCGDARIKEWERENFYISSSNSVTVAEHIGIAETLKLYASSFFRLACTSHCNRHFLSGQGFISKGTSAKLSKKTKLIREASSLEPVIAISEPLTTALFIYETFAVTRSLQGISGRTLACNCISVLSFGSHNLGFREQHS